MGEFVLDSDGSMTVLNDSEIANEAVFEALNDQHPELEPFSGLDHCVLAQVSTGDARDQYGHWIEVETDCSVTIRDGVRKDGSRSAHRIEHHCSASRPVERLESELGRKCARARGERCVAVRHSHDTVRAGS